MFFNRNFINALLYLALAGFVAWVFADLILYVVLAVILSGVLRGPTNYLSMTGYGRFRTPRGVAILLSFSIVGAVIALFGLLFIPLISDQVRILSQTSTDEAFETLEPVVKNLEQTLIKYNLVDQPPGFVIYQLKRSVRELFSQLQFTEILNQLVSTTSSFFIGLLAVLFITFFILLEKGKMRRRIIQMIPNRYFEVTMSGFYKVERLLSNYLLGLLGQLTSIFTLTSFGMIVGGINYAVTIGLFAALVNVIPFVGPLVGTGFALVIGLSTAPAEALADGGHNWIIFKVLFVQAVVHLIDNVVLQPLIFSKSVKTHPLEIFLVVIAGATLGGAVGMVVAIPTYTVLRVSFLELRKGFREYRIFQHFKTTQRRLDHIG
ncbi:MAG: AI-2E family transporter [Bernardetiaceae bacterium]|jgi:predicted PurR-regulated permease PerM|nr:AI-2E family transporter [Bernardetiaceae bacterium]